MIGDIKKEQLKQMQLNENEQNETELVKNANVAAELSDNAVKTVENIDINTAIEKTEEAIGKLNTISKDVVVPQQGEKTDPVKMLRSEFGKKWKSRIKTSDELGLNYYERTYKEENKKVLMFGGSDEFLNTDKYDNEKADIYYDVTTLTEEKLRDMWKGLAKTLGKPEGYIPGSQQEAAEIRNAVIEMAKTKNNRSNFNLGPTYDKSGDDTVGTFKALCEIGAFEDYKLISITQKYFSYKVEEKDFITNSLLMKKREEFTGKSSLNEKKFLYESQNPRSNDCFACSLSAIYNHFASGEKKDGRRLSKSDVRGYEPDYLTPEEYGKLVNADNTMSEVINQGTSIMKFAGKGKKTSGNVMAIGDVLFDSKKGMGRTDVAMVQKVYTLNSLVRNTKYSNEQKMAIKSNMINAMKKEIFGAIRSGQMVSMLTHNHYVTIVGIENGKITYLDSLENKADVPVTMDFEKFISSAYGRGYDNVELSYLRKVKEDDLDNLKKEYGGLDQDENTGELIRTNGGVSDFDVAHRSSIVIKKTHDELIGQGDGDIVNFMAEYICLNKTTFMNKEQRKRFEEEQDSKSEEIEKNRVMLERSSSILNNYKGLSIDQLVALNSAGKVRLYEEKTGIKEVKKEDKFKKLPGGADTRLKLTKKEVPAEPKTEEKGKKKEVPAEQKPVEKEKDKEAHIESEKKASVQKEAEKSKEKESYSGHKHLGFHIDYTIPQPNDSKKMRKIRAALSDYLNETELNHPKASARALNRLIKACDSYKFGKFECFKSGEALERLQEVSALRERALAMKGKDELIYTNAEENALRESLDEARGANFAKKAIAAMATAIDVGLWNLFRSATGNDKARYTVKRHYADNVAIMDRIFGRKKYREKLEMDEEGNIIQNGLETYYKRDTDTGLWTKNRSKTYAAEQKMIENDLIAFGGYKEYIKKTYASKETPKVSDYEAGELQADQNSEATIEYNKRMARINELSEDMKRESLHGEKKDKKFIAACKKEIEELKKLNLPYEKFMARREAYQGTGFDYIDEEDFLEEGYDRVDETIDAQRKLLAELKKDVPDLNVITSLEEFLSKNSKAVEGFSNYMRRYDQSAAPDMTAYYDLRTDIKAQTKYAITKINEAAQKDYEELIEKCESVKELIKKGELGAISLKKHTEELDELNDRLAIYDKFCVEYVNKEYKREENHSLKIYEDTKDIIDDYSDELVEKEAESRKKAIEEGNQDFFESADELIKAYKAVDGFDEAKERETTKKMNALMSKVNALNHYIKDNKLGEEYSNKRYEEYVDKVNNAKLYYNVYKNDRLLKEAINERIELFTSKKYTPEEGLKTERKVKELTEKAKAYEEDLKVYNENSKVGKIDYSVDDYISESNEKMTAESAKFYNWKSAKDAYDAVQKLKDDIVAEYKKETPDRGVLKTLGDKLSSKLNEYDLKIAGLKKKNIDFEYSLDETRAAIEAAKNKYDADEEMISQMTADNFTMEEEDVSVEITEVTEKNKEKKKRESVKRDDPYDHEAVLKAIADFEKFDPDDMVFASSFGMLQKYKENMKHFTEAHRLHGLMVTGITKGDLKLSDDRLMKLRAKFMCMFEMQNYMQRLNRLAYEEKLTIRAGLSDEQEKKIQKQVTDSLQLHKSYKRRMPVNPSDIKGFLASCELAVREDYDNRGETIERLYSIMEKGGSTKKKDKIPQELLNKKMAEFESNALCYDYLQETGLNKKYDDSTIYINAYNKKHGTDVKKVTGRTNLNYQLGKSTNEKVRLAMLCNGSPRERLDYCKEMLKEMKSLSPKELNGSLSDYYTSIDRKYAVFALGANATDVTSMVKDALTEMKKAKIEEDRKNGIEVKEDPKEKLKLPDDFKELGYSSLYELEMDMIVWQGFVNSVQGRTNTVAEELYNQHDELSYFSLQDLFDMDENFMDKMLKSKDAYLKKNDIERDVTEYEDDNVLAFIERFAQMSDFISIKLQNTMPLKEERMKGKLCKVVTGHTEQEMILQSERDAYFRNVIRGGLRSVESDGADLVRQADNEKLNKERKDARDQVERIEEFDNQCDVYIYRKEERGIKPKYADKKVLGRYLGCMAALKGDSEKETDERFRNLNWDLETTEIVGPKISMMREFEEAFSIIKDTSISDFNFDRIMDPVNGASFDLMKKIRLCQSLNQLMGNYDVLRQDEGVKSGFIRQFKGFAFTDEESDDIKAKISFIAGLSDFYEEFPRLLADQGHEKLDAIYLLSLSDYQTETLLSRKKLDNKSREYIQKVRDFRKDIIAKGFLPGSDMEVNFNQWKAKN